MRVAELIKKLSEYPPDTVVVIDGQNYGYDVSEDSKFVAEESTFKAVRLSR